MIDSCQKNARMSKCKKMYFRLCMYSSMVTIICLLGDLSKVPHLEYNSKIQSIVHRSYFSKKQ